jgi:hypothetical protein
VLVDAVAGGECGDEAGEELDVVRRALRPGAAAEERLGGAFQSKPEPLAMSPCG